MDGCCVDAPTDLNTSLSPHRICLLLFTVAAETYSPKSSVRCPTSLARRYPRARIASYRAVTKQNSV
ncbi:hypothetical protein BFJ71_g1949 [Fusarium oxysporum]|nr:hypothetical protein BFJ71_g1949 [Fusarium oxysporum]